MDSRKKSRLLKGVGLIALTIIVVVSVFLTIYFVDKNSKFESVDIGYTIDTKYYDFTVENVDFTKNDEENSTLVVYISIVGKKDCKIKNNSFKMDNASLNEIDNIVIKEGETKNVELKFNISTQKVIPYELKCFGYKYRLGQPVFRR